MSDSELQGLLAAIEDASIGDAPTVLAWLAGRRLELPETELNEALRRALLLLASGGDPHRDLDVDDRAVKAVAIDLYSEERLAALAAELDRLVLAARAFENVSRALLFLAADLDLAWRLFALGLLAEELAAEDE
jgi:hypothetical protein